MSDWLVTKKERARIRKLLKEFVAKEIGWTWEEYLMSSSLEKEAVNKEFGKWLAKKKREILEFPRDGR